LEKDLAGTITSLVEHNHVPEPSDAKKKLVLQAVKDRAAATVETPRQIIQITTAGSTIIY
jgi:hypothetical protein